MLHIFSSTKVFVNANIFFIYRKDFEIFLLVQFMSFLDTWQGSNTPTYMPKNPSSMLYGSRWGTPQPKVRCPANGFFERDWFYRRARLCSEKFEAMYAVSVWCWTFFLQSSVLITLIKMLLKLLNAFIYLLRTCCWNSVENYFTLCKVWFLPVSVTSLATYYILGGVVYQAPDIGSLINSRLVWITFFHINILANIDLIKAKYKENLIFCNECQWILAIFVWRPLYVFVAKLNGQLCHVFLFSFQQYINCNQLLLKVSRHFSYEDHSFNKYAKFFEKPTLDTHTYGCLSGGKKCLFFGKFWILTK